MTENSEFDHVIIGAGIIGISIGIAILEQNSQKKVLIIDKEKTPGFHASGRNSGVIHAGFYYSPESLKAKFCRLGNIELKKFCKENGLKILETGKVVVCQNYQDVARLEDLYERGISNGVDIEILNKSELSKIEPAAKTVEKFIWSPTTSVGNPKEIIKKLAEKFVFLGGKFIFDVKSKLNYEKNEVVIKSNQGKFRSDSIINAAGAYASELAKQVGVGKELICLPFLGAYKKSDLKQTNPRRLIYPVPNPVNPFLGVHTTNTLDNGIKIGPTAFPVIGKEQYKIRDGFSLAELNEFLRASKTLLSSNELDFFKLALEEGKKLLKKPLLKRAKGLTNTLAENENWRSHPAGIRAQLVNTRTKSLEMDYIVKTEKNVVHILNAVSPGWTSAIPFARWIVENQPNFN
jgi:L-2-hydroxyglutarate oxidase LhgO